MRTQTLPLSSAVQIPLTQASIQNGKSLENKNKGEHSGEIKKKQLIRYPFTQAVTVLLAGSTAPYHFNVSAFTAFSVLDVGSLGI